MVASLYGPEEEEKAIWVYLEHTGEELETVSLEILSKGREMADQMKWRLVGILLGRRIEHLIGEAFNYGADEIWYANDPHLNLFTVDAYARVLYEAVLQSKPSIFLLGATPNGRDLAGRLAVRFRTGLNADCSDLRIEPDGGVLISEVSGFGGGVLALIEMRKHRPQMATVRPGVFTAKLIGKKNAGTIVNIPVELPEELLRTRIIERRIGKEVDLTRVPVLVAGGRGIRGDFQTLQELADLLGGEIGATRPPVDEGYVQRERQIGQTGVVCSPKIAICCGISGAFHFVVGIEKAETVIAINTDPEAPIFEYSDYCIVGDYKKIVQDLIETLRDEGAALLLEEI
jgi:electron transfer flavoprotein alpha subunit